MMVNNGFGDLKVKVGEVEILCIRNILMNGNATIRKLLLDDQKSEVLELYEECEINSFLEIEKYYSGGCMELSENSICDILRFSIYYNDNRIMLICKKYLKTHMNESIIGEIFSLLNVINIQKLNEVKEISEDYVRMNGYRYLNEDSLLLKLNLKSLEFILNNQSLIIIDDNWLLNRLMKWYREVLKESSCEDNEEDVKEFKKLLKEKINENEIKKEEIEEDNLNELSELNIEIKERNNYIYVKTKEIKNNTLIKIIHQNYLNEEEEIELKENEIEELRNEEVKSDMMILLSNEDIKIVEIVLMIITKVEMSEIIPKEMKSDLLSKLIYEYKRNKRNLTLKCLCLFADDVESITTMKYLCGKEILYQILNEVYYLHSKSKELLIKYIQEMKLNEKEEEEMSKIIKNRELLEELLVKEISSFSYPHSEYSFTINDEISLIPSFDGDRCEFSISPPLPDGLTIDKESGIINGKVEKITENKEYEICCKNVRNEKKFKISLEFIEIKFTELNKNSNITISNNGKTITNNANADDHCYINLKMNNGIYHIKYQFHQNGGSNNGLLLGLSTDNTFSGTSIQSQSTTCNYCSYGGQSQDITSYCHIGTVVNKNPDFICINGTIYEVIVDMNKREFWISYNNSDPVLLVQDLPSPLYPYALPYYQKNSIELLSVSHQN